MFNAGKVVFGLIVFVALATSPLWYNGFTGKAAGVPDLEYPDPAVHGSECVAAKEYMRDSHMDLLNQWRDDVVRRGQRIHETADGRKFVMSLGNTCLACHQNKSGFCERCHDYLGVDPYCWECHVEPRGVE